MEIWKYENMEMWKYGNMEILKYGNFEILFQGKIALWKTMLKCAQQILTLHKLTHLCTNFVLFIIYNNLGGRPTKGCHLYQDRSCYFLSAIQSSLFLLYCSLCSLRFNQQLVSVFCQAGPISNLIKSFVAVVSHKTAWHPIITLDLSDNSALVFFRPSFRSLTFLIYLRNLYSSTS